MWPLQQQRYWKQQKKQQQQEQEWQQAAITTQKDLKQQQQQHKWQGKEKGQTGNVQAAKYFRWAVRKEKPQKIRKNEHMRADCNAINTNKAK